MLILKMANKSYIIIMMHPSVAAIYLHGLAMQYDITQFVSKLQHVL